MSLSENANEILLNTYNCYNQGKNYTVKTPPSNKIHEYNMALNEIKKYIVFVERSMIKISLTLSDEGIEYCLDNFL